MRHVPGPNLFNEIYLKLSWKRHFKFLDAPKLLAARKELIQIQRNVLLIVKMGPIQVSTTFALVDHLTIDIFLRNKYVGPFIKGTVSINRKVGPINLAPISTLGGDRDPSNMSRVL